MNEQQRKAMELALEALTATMSTHGFRDAIDEVHEKATAAIKEALTQDALQALHDENKSLGLYEQEPVAFLVYDPRVQSQELYFDDDLGDTDCCEITPLYTTPPQRTWVGLTDEQIQTAARNGQHHHIDFRAGVQFAEAAHGIKDNP